MKRKDKQLVPVAEFANPEEADAVWAALEDGGIPASVITDPEVFGQLPITRVWVERFNLSQARRLVGVVLEEGRTETGE